MKSRRLTGNATISGKRSHDADFEDENCKILSKCAMKLLSSLFHTLVLLNLTYLLEYPKSAKAVGINDNVLEHNGIGKSDTFRKSDNFQSHDIDQPANSLMKLHNSAVRVNEDEEDLHLMNEEDMLIDSNFFDESEYPEYENPTPQHDPLSEGILIVVAVDGTIAGLSKLTGEMIWKRSSNHSFSEKHSRRTTVSDMTVQASSRNSVSESSCSSQIYSLEPLVYTTTTTENSRSELWRTVAVPSILDGKVYLTASDVTVTTTAKELVARSPFADRRGRIYTGTSVSSTIALDSKTGEIIQVLKGTEYLVSKETKNKLDEEESGRERDVIWLGRVDYSVTISEPNSGDVDVHFRTSEILSSSQMILRNRYENQNAMLSEATLQDQKVPVQLEHSVEASRSLAERKHSYQSYLQSESRPELKIKNSVVVTPNGYLAYMDRSIDEILWVADENFDSPIAFCMDSVTGTACNLATVPDAVKSDSSPDYVSQEMKRQLSMLGGERDSVHSEDSHESAKQPMKDKARLHRDRTLTEPTTIVSSLSGSGQLFAMPLRVTPQSNFHSRKIHRRSSSVAHTRQSGIELSDFGLDGSPGPLQHADYLHRNAQDRVSEVVDGLDRLYNRRACCRDINVAGCLCSDSAAFHDHAKTTSKQQYALSDIFWPSRDYMQSDHRTFLTDSPFEVKESSAVVPFFDYDDYIRLLTDERPRSDQSSYSSNYDEHYNRKKLETIQTSQKQYKLLRILGSWLPPTIALIFVVSFELGRRKRQKEIDAELFDANPSYQSNPSQELQDEQAKVAMTRRILVCEDVVLGYGGHGTIVYKGLLEGRQVAVKRMLTTYHANADREISLLIESDGHPNVVRYFLKEVDGDFVYLALELCDMSLHDLITVMKSWKERNCDESARCDSEHPFEISSAVKNLLLQISSGVAHLHRLRIVHRDLKPANILLADISKAKSSQRERMVGDSVLECFENGQYVAKISDMGLGKQLLGQSSYGTSFINGSSLQGRSNSSVVGAKGTVGWQAPEVMACTARADTNLRNYDGSTGNSEISNSPIPNDSLLQNAITSRSVDIFSLGCVFYATLVPGAHPFGEWYEREANIMHNRLNLSALQDVSPEAFDLVEAMLQRNPKLRPSAKDVCNHPFFWTSKQKILFLCEFSDRIEADAQNLSNELNLNSTFLSVERNAEHVVGRVWSQHLDDELFNNVQRFRTYDTSSVRDLLRLIRNKHHHYDELSKRLKSLMGSNTSGLMRYFEGIFPRLVIHCYNICRDVLCPGDAMANRYSIKSAGKYQQMNPVVSLLTTSDSNETLRINATNETAMLKSTNKTDYDTSVCNGISNDESIQVESWISSNIKSQLASIADDAAHMECNDSKLTDGTDVVNDDTITIWYGSSAARTLNCRGWSRSDEEWTSTVLRKRDSSLQQCPEDSKFRTRLCNHWDVSYGTACPMRKKNKCIFAHGPVELRVKEGKRKRWGKLVDSQGDCNNPCHSGGEDTYRAARSIESERKDEGKWNTSRSQLQAKKNQTKKPKSRQAVNPTAQQKITVSLPLKASVYVAETN